MKQIFYFIVALALMTVCVLASFLVAQENITSKEPLYQAEVTYKWHYHDENNQSEERYVLEASIDSGDIIFHIRVPKPFYDSIDVHDSVPVAIVDYGPSIGKYPIVKGTKKIK
jgi:hypothetical protein